MSESNPFAITASSTGKTAEVRISGVIWEWQNHAKWFKGEIDKMNSNGVKTMKLHINTPGGDVFQANEISNMLDEFEGTIEGIGGALVASAGTYIALHCDTFSMPSNGVFMYHKPMGSMRGNEDKIEASLILLKQLTADYKRSYAEKTNLTEAQIEKNWGKGDVWLNAQNALKDGFITSVRKKKATVTKETTALFAACAAPKSAIPAVTKTEIQTKKEENMESLKVTALKLGLSENATQEEVNAKVTSLQADAKKAVQLEADINATAEAAHKKAVDDLIASLVTDKKMDAAAAEGLRPFADADFEACKAHCAALPKLEKLSNSIKGTATPSAAANAVKDIAFNAMTPEQKDQLAEEDPEAFAAKYEAYLDAASK